MTIRQKDKKSDQLNNEKKMKLRDISKIKSKSELKQKIEEYQEKMLQEKNQDKKIELGYIFDSLRGQYDKVVMQECYDRLKKVSSIEEKRKIMVDHLEIDLSKIGVRKKT